MLRNPITDLEDLDRLKDLVRENPWCTFITCARGRDPVASHYPVLLDEDEPGLVLLSHMGRPDDLAHELGRHRMMAIVQGPHGYISPGWYGLPAAVPTWNFVALHVVGSVEVLSADENLDTLNRIVDHFEDRTPEPYRLFGTSRNESYVRGILHGTVGFRLRADTVQAKDKLSQDKPSDVVDRIIAGLESPGPYRNLALAERMRRGRGPERR